VTDRGLKEHSHRDKHMDKNKKIYVPGSTIKETDKDMLETSFNPDA
jgi:hypothetical protein